MASPKIEVFFLFDSSGLPLAGKTGITFSSYSDETGAALSQPTIVEIGGGAYKFTPVFPTDKGIVYVINTNGANPGRLVKFIRPEDFNLDNCDTPLSTGVVAKVDTLDTKVTNNTTSLSSLDTKVTGIDTKVEKLVQIGTGRWKVFNSGPDANRLVLYAADGVTVLQKFNLFDQNGNPATLSVFERMPI